MFLVASTYGNGDPPNDGVEFKAKLETILEGRREGEKPMKHVK